MKPELRPPSRTRNGGRPDRPVSSSSAMRRSAMAPTSLMASAMMSAAKATGSAWKLPPEITSPVSQNTSGLSDAALASMTSTRAACARLSRHAPITCGMQRTEYGSCTRPQSACDGTISLPSSSVRTAPATAIWPGWPRAAWMRASKGLIEPWMASSDSAPDISAAANTSSAPNRPCQRERRRHLRAVEQRQAFLGAEHEGLEADAAHGLGTADHACRRPGRLALADQHAGHVRERRQVARRTDRALARNARQHARVEQRQQRIDQRGPHARVAARQAHGLGREHHAHHRRGQRLARAHAVRQHEVALQLGQVVVADARARKLAEAGVDAVDHLVVLHDVAHGGFGRFMPSRTDGSSDSTHAAGLDASQHRKVDLAGREGQGGGCWFGLDVIAWHVNLSIQVGREKT
jgi:hypothetical protein